MLTPSEGVLFGAFVEAILYGIYTSTMSEALRRLLQPSGGYFQRPSGIRVVTLTLSIVLYVNCSSNLAFGIVSLVQTYIREEVKKPGYWINIIRPVNVAFQTLLADMFLIYRCWVVNKRVTKYIVFPTITWLAGTCLTVYILVTRIRGELEIANAPTVNSTALLAAQSITTVMTNVYATVIISRKIYLTDKASNSNPTNYDLSTAANPNAPMRNRRKTPLQGVMRMVIESCLFYTLVSVADFISVVVKSDASLILSAIALVSIGIAFNQIIIQVAKERARERREFLDNDGRLPTLRFGSGGSTSSSCIIMPNVMVEETVGRTVEKA